MLVCKSCGITLPEDASFCPNCGVQLSDENKGDAPKPMAPIGDAENVASTEMPVFLSEVEGEKPKTKWRLHPAHLLLMLPVLILAGFITLIVVALNAEPATDVQEPTQLFHEGLVPVLVGDGNSEPLWGYMDREGKQVIEGKFDEVKLFGENGLAAVCQLGKWGFIDRSGKFVIPAAFEEAQNFGENDYAPVKANGSWGYIDKTGTFVINPQFDSAENFAENGLALVGIGDKYGYINSKGIYVIAPQYDNAKSFGRSGFAAIFAFGKWGMINEDGQYVINPQFDTLYPFTDNGLALIEKDGTYGYINRTGVYVISPMFEDASSFGKNGLALVKQNGKYGYINNKCEFVIPAEYDAALPFSDGTGLAAVCPNAEKGLWGYIDSSGNKVLDAVYTSAGTFCSGLAMVQDETGFCYIDRAGTEVFRPDAECLGAIDFTEDGYAILWYLGDKGEEFCVVVNKKGEAIGTARLSMVWFAPTDTFAQSK